MPWTYIAEEEDCPPGTAREFVAEGQVVALFNVESSLYALDGVCPQGIDIVREALLPAREKILGLDGAAPDQTAASTAFVMARRWSAFVCLTDERKRGLEEAGTLLPVSIPGIAAAYRLAEG